jgi:hypothetical protein
MIHFFFIIFLIFDLVLIYGVFKAEGLFNSIGPVIALILLSLLYYSFIQIERRNKKNEN